MQFLMSSHVSLGLLTHLRIWHDNKGQGEMASWYLSKIVVTDLQDNYRLVRNVPIISIRQVSFCSAANCAFIEIVCSVI